MDICFEKANLVHKDLIETWLKEPHVQESWDNSQEHKEDILNFMHGRMEPSSYAGGQYVYWIAADPVIPFALIMSIQETAASDIDDIKKAHLSKTGNSYSLDYMIGNPNYLGKGFGARTLSEFIVFLKRDYDPKADTFLIDPADDNPRAKHIYKKAGFDHVADFIMEGDCSGAGKLHHLLIRHLRF